MARTVNIDQQQAKRRIILHAAAQLFAEQGYHGTATAQICAAAGISAGNLFHYFPNKRALFAALLTGDDPEEDGKQADLAHDTEDAIEGLLAYVHYLASGVSSPVRPGLVVEAMLQAARDPGLAELMEHGSAGEEEHVLALLHRAKHSGVLDATLDVETSAAWIMTLISALYLHAATGDNVDPNTQLTLLRRTVQRYLQPGQTIDVDGHG